MACNSCKLARIKRQIEQRRKLAEMRAKAEAEKKKKEEALAANNVSVLTPAEEKIMGPNAIDPVAVLTVEVPAEIFTLIERSFDMAYETDGVFNPMIGPLVRLWGIGTENARIPAQSEIESVLPLLDYHQAVLDEDRHTVFLPEEGMALDLGAVGKGWTSDLVRDFLAERGVESAIINLGGNITVMGDHDGKPWRVGIQRPWAGGGSYFTIVEAEDTSLVTSGGYQRYIEDSDGTIYSNILSSSTGYPVETDLLSATAITSDGTLADMLSTVMFASGSVKAQEIAAGFGIRAVLLTEDSAVIDTDSPEGEVTVLEE